MALRVARNRALDRVRRSDRWEGELPPGGVDAVVEELGAMGDPGGVAAPADEAAPTIAGPAGDDELALVFMCCHPALSPDSRLALTLKVAVGLS